MIKIQRATLVWLICFSGCLFASIPAGADGLDYTLGLGARLLPQGGGFVAQGGYGYRLWGDQADGKFQYGYIRPAVKGYTSFLVSQIQAEVDIYPISIVGITLGTMQSFRNTDFATMDCTTVACRGNLGIMYVRIQGVMGYKQVFFIGGGKFTSINPSIKDRPFADENSMLVGRAGGDQVYSGDLTLGYKIDDRYTAGIYLSSDAMSNTATSNSHESFFIRRKLSDWNFLIGAGAYSSSIQATGFTTYAVVRWVGLPSIALF